ncbi:unnamed protein product [Notodromas monacha]|uniref:Methyltransferase type 11 domain-containing protein n=1 Tax=Notodromas monacha TaxID=399045 RepID=A0A7R9GGV9_9CRUS|nr:unnamed protein product [Notodromas monacha]CAG0920635.1 unnamed protein product [Notodromas monacha]
MAVVLRLRNIVKLLGASTVAAGGLYVVVANTPVLEKKADAWLFNKTLVSYNELASIHKAAHFASLREISSHDPALVEKKQIRIVDVGSGTGVNAPFYPKNAVVIGVDPNPEFESYFKRRLDQSQVQIEKYIVDQNDCITGKLLCSLNCAGNLGQDFLPKNNGYVVAKLHKIIDLLAKFGDVTPMQVEFRYEKYRVNELSKGEDMKQIPDASADVVITTMTLCHADDLEKFVDEIKRILVPGGKYYFWEHVDHFHKRHRHEARTLHSNVKFVLKMLLQPHAKHSHSTEAHHQHVEHQKEMSAEEELLRRKGFSSLWTLIKFDFLLQMLVLKLSNSTKWSATSGNKLPDLV